MKFAPAALAALLLSGSAFAAPSPEQVAEAALRDAPVWDGHNDVPEQLRERYGNVIAGWNFADTTGTADPDRNLGPMHTDIARMALDDALIWISERYGTSLESLRWGDAHQATHDHQVLGDVPLLRYFVNIRQSTSGGDNTLLRGRTRGGDGADAFQNVHGAGYRGVYDFADPDSSVFIIATGQSGHILSRHYDDLSQLWRRGEYIPMSLDPALARAAAVGITLLTPETR